MTLEEQKRSLRRLGNGLVGRWLAVGLAVLAAGFLAVGLAKGWVPMFMLAAFTALVAFAAHKSLPHVRQAARALDVGRRAQVHVAIEVAPGDDSPTYHAEVTVAPATTWRMEFIAQGWKPVAGTFAAEAHFLADVKWPVLLVTGDGLIFPRYAPKRR